MILNLSFGPNQIKKNSILRIDGEQYKRIQGFPALYIDRYSYIGQVVIRARYGEPIQTNGGGWGNIPEGAYSLHIGAFNSISWDVHFIIDEDHDYKSVSMAVCDLFKEVPFRHKRKGSIIIQNDVWIGQGCTVFGGVTIHNGAVVAGNSVVTKDVPPYCIVGGTPARVIKPRFDEETIRKLLEIQWWDWSSEKIKRNRDWFTKNPEEFADHFYKELPKPKSYQIDIPEFDNTYLFFPDFDEPYGVWKTVIPDFCKSFAERKDCVLVLFVEKSNKVQSQIQQIEELTKDIDADCCLYMYVGNVMEEEAAFSRSDYYITSRDLRTVKRTCLADKFNIPIISGVDAPIF